MVEIPGPLALPFQGPLRIPNLLREMAEVGSRRRAAIAREAVPMCGAFCVCDRLGTRVERPFVGATSAGRTMRNRH